MSSINENKFYQALESIFTGANIEGDSGYVNLLKIKSNYYRLILEQFKNEINKEQAITDSFKEEFFDRLYSFFEKYFSESGSVYFVKTANWQRVFEQVYTDNKDVVLFWKTHMLYYVKSDILFQSIDVNITDEESQQDYNFYFDVGNLQAKQNNEKKSLIFTFREIKEEKDDVDLINDKLGKKTFVFDVSYSERGNKIKIDDIVKATKIPETILEKAFATFKKQSEVDFFINKNANKFLTEQLDMYLHQILLNEENKFEQKRLDQLKTIKTFALKIIKFISQFEDELVRVWNKPKFALNSNYVITLDKLNDEIIGKIAKHKNLPEQVKEWQELGMIKNDFNFNDIYDKEIPLLRGGTEGDGVVLTPKYKFLPIDTKHFKDLEIEILAQFENLDEELDGRLIHSENYQALNTLQEKYKEKVQCIYIDPPFNTGSDFAYIDKFQDSTWLSLMNDRIEIARKFLRDDGSFYLHLDHNASHLGRILMDNSFGFDSFKNELIWLYRFYEHNINYWNNKHDNIFYYWKNKEFSKFYWEKISTPLEDASLKKFKYEDLNGRKFTIRGRNIKDSPLKQMANLSLEDEEKYPDLVYRQYLDEVVGVKPRDYFQIDILAQGNPEIINFQTQKPEKFMSYLITAVTDFNDLILDFFTGSATTIATAHKLGRKWLGVEMGDHFDTVDLPRMKTVLFGKISGISKELMKQTPRQPTVATPQEGNFGNLKVGGFFKYYSLEQYEDTLRNMKYKDSSPNSIFDTRKAFEQYIFYADQKFAHVLEVGKEKLEIDFDKLYPNIDFAETISNLLGLPIKRITKNSLILQDREVEKEIKTDYKNMNDDEKVKFLQVLKPLIWWGY
jgi:adenine-specific DNA-methyltransferase